MAVNNGHGREESAKGEGEFWETNYRDNLDESMQRLTEWNGRSGNTSSTRREREEQKETMDIKGRAGKVFDSKARTHKSREILTEPLADQKTTMWINENQLR